MIPVSQSPMRASNLQRLAAREDENNVNVEIDLLTHGVYTRPGINVTYGHIHDNQMQRFEELIGWFLFPWLIISYSNLMSSAMDY